MGTRGRVPGQWHRENERRRPKAPTADRPRVPAGMPAEAARLYRRLGKVLDLSAADEPLLATLAGALWIQNEALCELESAGLVVADTTHTPARDSRKNPAFNVWRGAAEVVKIAAMRLGASPLDRLRLPEVQSVIDLAGTLAMPDDEWEWRKGGAQDDGR